MAHGPMIDNISEIKGVVTQLLTHYTEQHGLHCDNTESKLFRKALQSHYFAEGLATQLETTLMDCIEYVVSDSQALPTEFYRILLFMMHVVMVYVEQHLCVGVQLTSEEDSAGSMTTLASAPPTMMYLYITTVKEFTDCLLSRKEEFESMACPCLFDYIHRAHEFECTFSPRVPDYMRFRETRANVMACMQGLPLRERVLQLDPTSETAVSFTEQERLRATKIMTGIIPNIMSQSRTYDELHPLIAAILVSREMVRKDAFAIACNRVGAGLVTLLSEEEATRVWTSHASTDAQLRRAIRKYAPIQLDYLDTQPPIADPLDRARSGCLSVINVLSGGVAICMHTCFTAAMVLYSLIRRVIGTRVPSAIFINSGAAIAQTSRYPLLILVECTATELHAAFVLTPGARHDVSTCRDEPPVSHCVFEAYHQLYQTPTSTAGTTFLTRSIDLLASQEPCPNIPAPLVDAFIELQAYLHEAIQPDRLPFLQLEKNKFTFHLD